MAEENKNPEVELDTDGVNEERVEVPEAKEPDESFAQKEDVDLGYTDIKDEENVRTYRLKGAEVRRVKKVRLEILDSNVEIDSFGISYSLRTIK